MTNWQTRPDISEYNLSKSRLQYDFFKLLGESEKLVLLFSSIKNAGGAQASFPGTSHMLGNIIFLVLFSLISFNFEHRMDFQSFQSDCAAAIVVLRQL